MSNKVFGCRHPDSLSGTWDRALVVTKYAGDDSFIVCVFMDGKDYIAHVKTLAEAKAVEADFHSRGWTLTMTDDDLYQTAGVRRASGSHVCAMMLFVTVALGVAASAAYLAYSPGV